MTNPGIFAGVLFNIDFNWVGFLQDPNKPQRVGGGHLPGNVSNFCYQSHSRHSLVEVTWGD